MLGMLSWLHSTEDGILILNLVLMTSGQYKHCMERKWTRHLKEKSLQHQDPTFFANQDPPVLKIFVPTLKLMRWSRQVILPHIFSRTPTTGNWPQTVRKISQDCPGLPSDIDAAFTWHKSKSSYFLKGNKYWKFENMRPQRGYPKDIKDGFPGIPTGVDAAFVWGGNGKIYFFKGSKYWKFDKWLNVQEKLLL